MHPVLPLIPQQSNMTFLVFTSVALHVPFRLHLAVQAACVALLARNALPTFCASNMLTSTAMQHRIAVFHELMSLVSMPLTPVSAALKPQGG